MKHILIPLGTALIFGLVSAQEETGMAYSDFDTDASGDVSYEEFSAGYGAESSRYSDFDADASGGIDQNEFTSGLYRSFDENDDQALTEDEFNAGTSAFYIGEEYEGAAYSDLDSDASGDVSEEEFTTGFDASSTYSEFDADASGDVSEEEFTRGIYNTADANDDGALTEDEFNNAFGLLGAYRNNDIARDVDPDVASETLTSIDTRDPGNYVADSQLRALYTLVESPVEGGELEFSPAVTEEDEAETDEPAVGLAADASDETGELTPLPCTGECLEVWPPLTIEPGTEPTVSEALDPELVGTIELEDGTVQLTYGGYPLHYFSGDEMQGGRLNGIGVETFGGSWYAVSATTGVPLETDSSANEGEE